MVITSLKISPVFHGVSGTAPQFFIFHCQISFYTTQEWIDEFLTWDPADYGGLTAVVVEPKKMWVPKLAIGNRYRLTGFKKTFSTPT